MSACCAAAPGVPGHTGNEYCAYDCALSSGPGLAAGDAPEALGAADADGPGEPAGREGLTVAGDEALPASVPGASPEWRADQPWTARPIPVRAGTPSRATPSRPARLPGHFMP